MSWSAQSRTHLLQSHSLWWQTISSSRCLMTLETNQRPNKSVRNLTIFSSADNTNYSTKNISICPDGLTSHWPLSTSIKFRSNFLQIFQRSNSTLSKQSNVTRDSLAKTILIMSRDLNAWSLTEWSIQKMSTLKLVMWNTVRWGSMISTSTQGSWVMSPLVTSPSRNISTEPNMYHSHIDLKCIPKLKRGFRPTDRLQDKTRKDGL